MSPNVSVYLMFAKIPSCPSVAVAKANKNQVSFWQIWESEGTSEPDILCYVRVSEVRAKVQRPLEFHPFGLFHQVISKAKFDKSFVR